MAREEMIAEVVGFSFPGANVRKERSEYDTRVHLKTPQGSKWDYFELPARVIPFAKVGEKVTVDVGKQ